MAGGRLYVRVGEVELKRWHGEAARAGLDFSDWVRRRLDADVPVGASALSAPAAESSGDRKLVAEGFDQDDSGECDPERDAVVGEEF